MTRILVVDDDCVVRELLEATLGFDRYRVSIAEDGEAALAAFERPGRAPDLVVLDLDLPGTSGLAVLRRLRGLQHRVPVVVLTGSGREREAELRAAGASAYLLKPFSPLGLLAEIEATLAG